MNRRWIPAILVAVSCLGLIACPNPLTREMIRHVKDDIAPVITITAPAEGSLCANIVEVTGQATDAATSGGGDGQLRTLAYAVLGSAVGGPIDVASGGAYSFQFSTVTLGSSFTLSITAVD